MGLFYLVLAAVVLLVLAEASYCVGNAWVCV